MITVPSRKIVDENGDMTQEFLTWVNQMTNIQIIEGTGSPEGVVAAEINKFYKDVSAGSGSILYIKNLGDIGKDPTQGWILV